MRGRHAALRDPARLAALRESGLLDPGADTVAFDRLAALARRLLAVPSAAVTMVTGELEVFLGGAGLPEALAERRQAPLTHSFCKHVVLQDRTLAVADAERHPTIWDNPATTEFDWRAFLGVPLRTEEGRVLGTLAVFDRAPREWTADEVETLESLGATATSELRCRTMARAAEHDRERLRASEERFRILYEDNPAMYFTLDEGGRILSVNRVGAERLGYAPDELVGRSLFELVHPDDHDVVRRRLHQAVRAPGRLLQQEVRKVRKGGEMLWVRDALRAIRENGRVVLLLACEDISGLKASEARALELLREQEARAQAERAARRSQFLSEASSLLVASLNPDATLETLARLCVPRVADLALIDVVEDDGAIRRVAAAHADPALAETAEALKRFPPSPEREHGVPRVLATGEPTLAPEASESDFDAIARTPGHRELLRRLGLRSYMIVPLFARGRVIGAITLATSTSDVRYDADDLAFAEELARHAALAVDNAHLYASARRARLEAERAEERLKRILAINPDGIVLLNAEGRISYVNSATEEILGMPREEIVGTGYDDPRWEVETPEGEAIPPSRMPFSTVLHTHESVRDVELVLQRGTGESVTISLNGAPLLDRTGEFLGMVASMRDITRRRRAEEAQRFLIEASEALVSSLDYHGTLEAVARLALPHFADYCLVDVVERDGTIRRMVARHADPAKQPLVEAEKRFPPDPAHPTGAARVLATGRPSLSPEVDDKELGRIARGAEHLKVLKRLRPRSYMVVPLVARERIVGALTFASTRPARRYGPDDLVLAEELAGRAALAVDNARLHHETQNALRARDEVLSIVAHDLRNPINTILMSTQLLELPLEGAQQRKQQRIIRRTAEGMNRLVQDLLDVARIEAGRLSIERAPIDACGVVVEAYEQFQAPAAEKGIALVLDSDAGRDLRVHADRSRVLQVLSNLVGNAVKFTPAGGRVTIRLEPDDDAARFSVVDTGPGIAPEDLPNLFERFWQAKETAAEGAGLGLAISKGIVEAHDGRIWAESRPGVGSTFAFTLPHAESAIRREAA